MKFVAILLLAAFLPAVLAQCKKYVCDPKHVTWPSALTCGMQDPETATQYDVRSCPSGQVCAGGESFGYTCATPVSNLVAMYPGEPCNEDFLCLIGTCMNGKCYTLSSGDACINIQDCGGNLTCSNGKCVTLASIGQPCLVNTDCVQSAGCVGADLSENPPVLGKCVEYLSVAPQNPAPNCAAAATNLEANPFCSSSYCYQSSPNVYLCADVLRSSQKLPYNCSNAACTSVPDSQSKLELVGSCECSYDGNQYCAQFPGDPDFARYSKYQVAFQSSKAIENCNTIRNNGSPISYMNLCSFVGTELTDEMKVAYYRAFEYAVFVNAPNCVLKILAPTYYHAEKGTSWLSWLLS